MSNSCFSDLIRKLEAGGAPDELIPYSFHGSREQFIELLMIYIKYGKNDRRLQVCREKLKEYAAGTDSYI